jgi:hypothetical protein
MAATVVQGVRGTQQLSTESRRVRDVTAGIAKIEPDAGPLTTLLMRLRKKAATDPKIEWYEDELLPRFDKLGAALTAGATTMTVGNYKAYRKGDLVRVNDAEIVYVTATPANANVSITRAAGETAARAADQNARLHILSNANEEGASGRDIISTQKVNQYNYCQILRHPFGTTATQDATDTHGGKDKDEEKANALIEHKKEIEHALLFGERWEDTTGAHPKRAMRGCVKFIQTNVAVKPTLTEPEWEDFLRICFRYGKREKVILCSPKLITVINGFARGKLETKSDESTYGVTMTRYQNAGRKVMLIEHHLLTNDALNDLSGVAGYGILLDIGSLTLRYLQGRATRLKQNIQDNDVDGNRHEYISELSLEMSNEKQHGLLLGVQE